jgi:hypothetical protein
MQSLTHSQLSPVQLDRVAYLFADAHFGTDASAFSYEVDARGNVKGRVSNQRTATSGRSKRGAPVFVTAIVEVHITDEQISHAHFSMDALAVSIASKIIQLSKLEEVNQ